MICEKCSIEINDNNFDITYDIQLLCSNCCIEKENEEKINKPWYCYILRSQNPKYKNYSYVGKTNNPKRRLRQHNGYIKGGAFRTKRTQPNEFYCVIKGFESNVEALQAEWRIKHPTCKRRKPYKFCGVDGRILGLETIFKDKQFTSNSKRLFKNIELTMWITKDKAHLIKYIPNNINLIITDKIIFY